MPRPASIGSSPASRRRQASASSPSSASSGSSCSCAAARPSTPWGGASSPRSSGAPTSIRRHRRARSARAARVLVALIAVTIAIPLGTCAALFITNYASTGAPQAAHQPRRPAGRHPQPALRDLGVPLPRRLQSSRCRSSLTEHFGWIPFFATEDERHLHRIDVHRRDRRLADGAARSSPRCRARSSPRRRRRRRKRRSPSAAPGGAWSARSSCRSARAASSAGRCSGSVGRSGETIAVSLLLPQVPELTRPHPRERWCARSRASSPCGPAATTFTVSRPDGRRPGAVPAHARPPT